MNQVQRLLDSVAELQEKANVNAVFGEPVTIEGRTVIPVAKMAYGFSIGIGYAPLMEGEAGGEKETADEMAEGASGVGGGGGIQARPFAVVEVTPESTRVEPIVDEQKLALAGSLLVGWGILCVTRTLVKIFGRQE
jgi:uncharacterized spore protein YtfJ